MAVKHPESYVPATCSNFGHESFERFLPGGECFPCAWGDGDE